MENKKDFPGFRGGKILPVVSVGQDPLATYSEGENSITRMQMKYVSAILEENDQAYADAVLEWGRRNGYDVGILSEEKIREAFRHLMPVPSIRYAKHEPGSIVDVIVELCPYCRTVMETGGLFCPMCGQKVERLFVCESQTGAGETPAKVAPSDDGD